MACDATFKVANSGHFEFLTDLIYQIQQNISRVCDSDPWLMEWRLGDPVLTINAARALTGRPTSSFTAFWNWTAYPRDRFLSQLQAWKLPLLQLILTFPRPPYGTAVEMFSIFHLVGDPIDTVASLVFTLQVSQQRMKMLKRNGMKRKKLLQLSLLASALEECGNLGSVVAFEHSAASGHSSWDFDYEAAADALAADRNVKVLPVITSICAFLASIALSYAKAAKMDWDTRSPRHIFIIGIAFSITLASTVPAVLLAAIVGVPQSATSTRRILIMSKATRNEGKDHRQQLPERDTQDCVSNGLVPSWQCNRWNWITASRSEASQKAAKRWVYRELSAASTVAIVSSGATLLSSRVPPDGCMNCQTRYAMVISWTFIINYCLGIVLSTLFRARNNLLFWLTMAKDICATLLVILTILFTMAGSLNQPGCWASCDGNLLLLPDTTRPDLEARLRREYPSIISASLAFLTIIFGLTTWLLWDGISVYLQGHRQVSMERVGRILPQMERERLGQVALWLAPLFLVLAALDASDRGSGRVTPLSLLFLNCALVSFSLWKLYSSHRIGRESHRNARANLREAFTNAQNPTQEINDATWGRDPEAQLRDKSSQSLRLLRGCRTLRWWRSTNEADGGHDDPDAKPKRHQKGDTTEPEKIIPLCVYESTDSLPLLIELEAKNCPSDDLFFKALNKVVIKRRLSGWSGLLTWCGLRRVMGIHYVKFRLFQSGYAEILRKPAHPKATESHSNRPTEEDIFPATHEADGKAKSSVRTLTSQALLFFLRNPTKCAGSNIILRSITHKLDGRLDRSDAHCVGYGMGIEVGYDEHRLNLLRFTLIVLSMCFGLGWSLNSGDVQSGFAISGALAILATALVAICKD